MSYIGNNPTSSAFNVQQNGSTVITNPSTFNFTGAGVTVTDNAGVADITITGGGGGGGSFDTSLTNQIGYALTTSLSDTGVSCPVNRRVIMKSIHVTNLTGTTDYVTGQISFDGGGQISIGDKIPVPAGASVELLRRPKVMKPLDVLSLKADASSSLHAVLAWTVTTDLTYFGSGADVTTTSVTDAYVAGADSTIESILLANDDTVNDAVVTVTWTDGSNAIQGYYVNSFTIPAKATVEILESAKLLPNGHKIRVSSTSANRVEVMVTGKTN